MAIYSTTQELYCLAPMSMADTIVEQVRDHLAARGIATIVDRRAGRPVPYEIARQRAMHLPRELPELPEDLTSYVGSLRLVQRMAPAGLALADAPIMDVVQDAKHGDGPASSELIFRISGRVHSRLQSRHGRDAARDIESVLGRVLDRLEHFDGYDQEDFFAWLDSVVDDRR